MATPEPKEIRECYADYRSAWQSVRDEGAADMRAISINGPWDDTDREERENHGRPCLHLDQINQFLNQATGNIRKTKRAIKVTPKGNGANDRDAERRSSLVMGIEERSRASQIYISSGFEPMIQRSYGFAVIRTEYTEGSNFDQEILIKPVANPDTILLSPHYKQPDASDIPEGFILDRILKSKYAAKYPNAKITDFAGEAVTGEHISDWITEKNVQIAEYWRVEYDRSKVLLVQTAEGPLVFTEEEWEKLRGKMKGEVKRERTIENPRVMQYLTNGLEILDDVEWAGTRIPIISCLGPERWTTEGGNSKRELLSMVRFARDPQMLADYLASGEAEEAGQIPKSPFIGYKGQFESDAEAWETVTKQARGYIQVDPVIDGATGQVLPIPTRPSWTPNFQEWEISKDAAGRSVQAAMGITPIPDAAQRRNQKSGVALQKIDDMENLGLFHFVDRYENCFLHNMGWQINELITPIIDTERDMPMTQPDGSRSLVKVVGRTSHPLDEQGQYEVGDLPEDHIHTAKGEFGVTISSGPSEDSEREEQGEFVDQLIENAPNLPPPGSPQAKILALGIRMRPTLGPIGRQIADIFDPPDPSNLPPEAQAIVQNLQSQLQQLMQENQALHMDRAGRVLEQQTKLRIEAMKGQHSMDSKTVDFITQIVKAELAAKSKANDAQAQSDAEKELAMLGFQEDHHAQAHAQSHELAMAGMQHEQAKELAEQNANAALTQNAQQAALNPPQQGQ